MTTDEYYQGRPGAQYGIWNDVKREFQFGICEDTPALAIARLKHKIGRDSRKWRFRVRRLTGEALHRAMEAKNEKRAAADPRS